MKKKAVIDNIDPQFLHKSVQKNVTQLHKNPLHAIHVSAAAFVNPQKEVLLCCRPDEKDFAGLWEFPGGKLEPNELPEQALMREIKEELSVQVSMKDMEAISFETAWYAEKEIHIIMYLYALKRWEGEFETLEHKKITWVPISHLDNYIDMMPPIDQPLAKKLIKLI